MAKFCPECGEHFDEAAQLCPYDGAELESRRDRDDSHIGHVVDERFRLDSLIGRGGMGRVYEATQLSVGRRVAVKMIRTGGLEQERIKRRFFREAKLVSELSHPNIVTLLDFGEDAELGVPYIAMEYIEGLDVREALDEGRFHPRVTVEIASQMAAALVEAHGAGIVHRDLKTDNVLLVPVSSGGFQAKVIDFGIALPTENTETLTHSGMICGTPKYVSPEQARNDAIDHRTDLYSLGVVLYEMLTGELPFESDSALNVMMKHVREAPPTLPDRLGPNAVPEQLATLVDDLLAKSPDDRPPDAQAVRRRLQSIQRSEGWDTLDLDTGREMRQKLQPWILPKISRSEGDDSATSASTPMHATDERPPPAFSAPTLGGEPPTDSSVRLRVQSNADESASPGFRERRPDSPPRIIGVPRTEQSPRNETHDDETHTALSSESAPPHDSPSSPDASRPPTSRPSTAPDDESPVPPADDGPGTSSPPRDVDTDRVRQSRTVHPFVAASIGFLATAAVVAWWWTSDLSRTTEVRERRAEEPERTGPRIEQAPKQTSPPAETEKPPSATRAKPTPPHSGKSRNPDASAQPSTAETTGRASSDETTEPDEDPRGPEPPPNRSRDDTPRDEALTDEIEEASEWLTNE